VLLKWKGPTALMRRRKMEIERNGYMHIFLGKKQFIFIKKYD
jgi:hypothetical protein